MYRTMEMRVEPKLSLPERLIISGNKPKVWFGYFLFAAQGIISWLKESFIGAALKLICFLLICGTISSLIIGAIILLTWIPSNIAHWIQAGILSLAMVVLLAVIAKVIVVQLSNELSIKANDLKEAALQKLGPPTPPCCELFGPPQKIRFQNIPGDFQEVRDFDFKRIKTDIESVRKYIEEDNNVFLSKLSQLEEMDNVRQRNFS